MRFKSAVVATLGLVAAVFLGAAGTGAAAPAERDFKPYNRDGNQSQRSAGIQTTSGNSFLEINGNNELIYWSRANESAGYNAQRRGVGWGGSKLITSLDENHFLEVKPGNELALWTWNGSYTQQIIGTGWGGTRLLTGVAPTKFLEVNQRGELVIWFLEGTQLFREVIGTGWGNAKHIAGLDDLLFLEVKQNGNLSTWAWNGQQLVENVSNGTGAFAKVRLMAGLDADHWLYIDANNRQLVEYQWVESEGVYKAKIVGVGWGGSRLLG
ncbi:hypothetical protein JOF56_001921 [Kibdelosporangium banguiense]|uniref:Tachylectin n=1 Tax=Kibdelosporangium banguiense TaxID=1365924 RepID=A0ABS4TCG9_9PSEU|nr:hypothetical protein [Kibdelosporangium banguiense]MBP2321536.1 hypothetical protein [Kibdelosporangium banguiense]